MPVFLLDKRDIHFPPVDLARSDGLLAVGGDLCPKRLILAYSKGIFPWYNQGEPILWWSPDPRLVLFPEELHVPRRLERTIRQGRFSLSCNRAFREVMSLCGALRQERGEVTWINQDMIDAYCKLNEMGYALSVESWQDGELVGGLYGVLLGSVFFGESMFTKVKDASKVAFVCFVRTFRDMGLKLIDCQVETAHLRRFGARAISRQQFSVLLEKWVDLRPKKVSQGPLRAC